MLDITKDIQSLTTTPDSQSHETGPRNLSVRFLTTWGRPVCFRGD
jgi:hypothetical protein